MVRQVYLGVTVFLLVQVGIKRRHELGQGVGRSAGHNGLPQLLGGRMQREGQAHPRKILCQLQEEQLCVQSSAVM